MIAIAAINPIWITLGPIFVINGVLLVSFLVYHLWWRKRMVHKFEGLKDHSSRLLSTDTTNWWLWTTDPIVKFFVRMHMGPNTLTAIGFLFAAAAGYLFSRGWFGYAGWVMMFGGTFDIFDGRVARITGKMSRSGAFFDAVMDRFGEGLCMLGLAVYFRGSWMLSVVIAAMIGSFLVSYTKARAEAMGVECKVGTMQRPERIVYLGVASIFDPVMRLFLARWWDVPPPALVMSALIAIAVMTNGTAVYRMIHTMNALDTKDRRKKETIPQLITRLSTPAGREAFWEKARYGYDRSRAAFSTVVLFLAGGAQQGAVSELSGRGELPNISRHIIERGGCCDATGAFPSTVGPSVAPFVTGCFPGTCNIPGTRWFDRSVPASRLITMNRFRDYLGWGSYVMDHDLSKSVRTVFEYSRQAVNIFGMLNRGCGPVRDPAFLRLHNRFYRVRRPEDVEEMDEAAFHWFSSAIRRETDFVLYSFPTIEPAWAGGDEGVVGAYRRLDRCIGRAADILRDRGLYERTALLLAGDHGRGEFSARFDLMGFLSGRYRTCHTARRLRDWQDAEVIAFTSGTSMAHIYVRRDESWEERTFFEEIERRGLVGSLLEQKGIDMLAGRSVEGGIVVQSRRGRAHILEDADGRITYIAKGGDPFGYGGIGQVMDAKGAIEATASSPYPDGILQMLQLFRSRRAGDLVAGASEGFAFIGDGDRSVPDATHGSLRREHMSVPFAASMRLGASRVRTADVFALMLSLLGIEPAHAMDGALAQRAEVAEAGIAATR